MSLNDPIPAPWWRDAVVYQVYVRSFADSDGDGLGDLPGITSRLPYLRDLGVDALWITPFYPSPQHDAGYDVSDYVDVDPRFGRLADADALLEKAHALGLKVVVDLVPNHTSDEHEWFQKALAADVGSPERERYMFRPGKGRGRTQPPNNWGSVFGGIAWEQLDDGDWYLHIFDRTQPDLNWRNPEVRSMFEDVLRFWLDRGVDGFRVDVAHGLFKDKQACATRRSTRQLTAPAPGTWRRCSSTTPRTSRCGTSPRSTRSTGTGAASSTGTTATGWPWPRPGPRRRRAPRRTSVPTSSSRPSTSPGCWRSGTPPTWPTASAGRSRPSTRSAPTRRGCSRTTTSCGTRRGTAAARVGVARARAATLAMLALPGSSYLYQGEELGLESVDVPEELRQDPAWFRTGVEWRDHCRVPMPWKGTRAPFGFGGRKQPWLPMPAEWAGLTVEAQTGKRGSTLELYRKALKVRRTFATTAPREVEILDRATSVLAFRRGPVTVVLNAGTRPVALPKGKVLVNSGRLVDGKLPPNTAVWIRQP